MHQRAQPVRDDQRYTIPGEALHRRADALLGAGVDGRRATTHWAVADRLAERFPEVMLDVDAIRVRDGKIRTAAGVTAGLDLALALVEEDLGADVARRVAAQLVMYFRRNGGQLQYSRKGAGSPTGRSALQQVQRSVIANPSKEHAVMGYGGNGITFSQIASEIVASTIDGAEDADAELF